MSLALLAVVLAWYAIFPGWRMLLLPLPIGLALVAAAGAGLWLSALNAQYRDVRYAVPFLVQMAMYSTPIVYSLGIVPEPWRTVFALNPMVAAVEGFRSAVLGTGSLTAGTVALSSLSARSLLGERIVVLPRDGTMPGRHDINVHFKTPLPWRGEGRVRGETSRSNAFENPSPLEGRGQGEG